MRHFLSKMMPPFDRVLLVESASRLLFEDILSGLYDVHANLHADLVTFEGAAGKFSDGPGSCIPRRRLSRLENKEGLYAELASNRYNVIVIICAAQPIMTKWKWMLALRVPAKLLVLNENCDYFWFDRAHVAIIWSFILYRAGLSGAGALPTLARILIFPFALLYLILFAATVHLRRKLRTL